MMDFPFYDYLEKSKNINDVINQYPRCICLRTHSHGRRISVLPSQNLRACMDEINWIDKRRCGQRKHADDYGRQLSPLMFT